MLGYWDREVMFSLAIWHVGHAWCRLKDGLKKYGKTGIYVYLGISFSITTCKYRYR